MTSLPIAVWERTPYWFPELQRQLQPLGARVMDCRVELDIANRVAAGAKQLVIALPCGERLPLRSVQRWVASGLHVHVVLPATEESLRWFLYEMGVTSVFDFEAARASLVKVCVG